jgi:hypothetical protein
MIRFLLAPFLILLFSSTNRKQALVSNAEKFEPPAWSCGNADNIMVRRSLSDGVHDEDHDHSHHDHSDHHFDPSNIDDTIADLKRSLRGSELHLGKRRRVQGASFAHWVDIYIEIDPALCTANGEFCTTTTIGPRTVNYGEFGVHFCHPSRV